MRTTPKKPSTLVSVTFAAFGALGGLGACSDASATSELTDVTSGGAAAAGSDVDSEGHSLTAAATATATSVPSSPWPLLIARAVLPAATFAPGPTSGQFIAASNGINVPFVDQQPVQGFSAFLADPSGHGRFLAMADNGYGALENSADFNLRVYRLAPRFESILAGPAPSTCAASSSSPIPITWCRSRS
jgi:hypothetical protein